MTYISSSLRYKGKRTKRTPAQKRQTLAAALASGSASTASLATSDADKENATVEQLQNLKRRADGYQRALYNERKKVKRSHAVAADQSTVLADTRMENQELRAEVDGLTVEVAGLEAETSSLRDSIGTLKSARNRASNKLHTLSEKIRRFPDRLDTAINKAAAKAREEISQLFAFTLKEKGVVPDDTRNMINDLVALDGVRPNKVVGVLKRIAINLGIAVNGDASDRTVRRIVKEGGVASNMQFVEAVGVSKGAYIVILLAQLTLTRIYC
jgi:prefoldin subunit 5